VVLAGPNGAGKSTAAAHLLSGVLAVDEFVNADVIAGALAPGEPQTAAVDAGRRMLGRLKQLAAGRATFAFETTLAGRGYCDWLEECIAAGYAVHIVFLWLQSPDLAVRRVAQRVAVGGHDIPEPVVRRRYLRGLRNFLTLYRPLATTWAVYDNSGSQPQLVVAGRRGVTRAVADRRTWAQMRRLGATGG
jgi:predicted ABC-type ATPase